MLNRNITIDYDDYTQLISDCMRHQIPLYALLRIV